MSLRFAPRWYWILLAAAGAVLFVRLGFWQWHRGEHRREQWQEFAHGDAPAVEATAASLTRLPQYTRVRITGAFDAAHQFLLENISHNGAPGYQVLTVLTLGDGSRLLADRGWVPFSGYRDKLPDVAFDAAAAPPILTGRLSPAPVAGLAAGQQPPALDWSMAAPVQLSDHRTTRCQLRRAARTHVAASGCGFRSRLCA